MKLENNSQKGFTLIELLVTVAVLGIIVGLSIPIVRNIQLAQTEKRYITYMDSVSYSAKLYTDSYSEDLFGDGTTGCQYVDYQTLSNYKLLKDIDMSGISCNSDLTAVKIVKYNDKYYYKPFIGCGAEKNGKAINADIFRPEKLDKSSVCISGNNKLINIEGVPATDDGLINKEYAPKVRIVSETGVNKEKTPRVSYGYSYDETPNIIGGEWLPVEFKIANKALQEKWIRESKTQYFPSTSTLPTPGGLTGDLYLVIKVDLLEDLNGYPWQTGSDNYIYLGPYRVDNEPPSLNDSRIISSAGDNYQSKKPKLDFHVTDEHFSAESDLKMCYSYDTEQKCPVPTSYSDLSRMKEYKDYNPNKILKEISDNYNGTTHEIFITIADAAGNTVSQKYDYRVANSYKLTFDNTEGTRCNYDHIYQIEDQPWTKDVVDEEGFNKKAFCKTTRTGYTLNGWYTEPNGKGKQVKTTDLATSDLKVYANWKINTYKLTYNSNGGKACSPSYKNVQYNAAYGKLCTPIRKGYTFDGWYTAATGGTKVSSSTKMGAANKTIYAHWTINTYKLTLNPNGGKACTPSTKNVKYNNAFGNLCSPTRDGYNFVAWYDKASGGSKVTASTKIEDHDTTIYAHWAARNYTLTLNPNGGNACNPSTKTVTYNTAYGTLCNPTRNGYTFAGWYTAASGGTKVDANTKMGVGNTTIYAHWNPNPVYVTFNGNGSDGGSTARQTCYYNQACTLSRNGFTKTGHTWTGWFMSASGGSALGSSVKLTGNITVYAHWDLAKYKINYNGNTHNSGSTPYSECAYNSNCQLRSNGFDKIGHDFAGWWTTATGGTKYGTYTQLKNDITVYAHWSPKPYAITYNGNTNTGGSTPQTNCNYNTTCTLATNGFTKTGYTWTGWWTTASGGTKYGSTVKITGNLPVFAQWKINSYKLTYSPSGLCNPTYKTLNYNANYGTLCNPSQNGHTFTGWYTKPTGGIKVEANNKMGAGDTTIYGRFSANPVTVTFKGNGNTGGSMVNQTCYYNENCTLSRNGFTKTGHTWKGWFASASGGNALTSPLKLTGNTTVYAQWTPNVHTITYDANGGSGTMTASSCNYGASCTLKNNGFTYTGHSFDGWWTAASGGTKYGATTTLTGNIRVYAHWKANPVILSYNGNGSTGGSTGPTTCLYNKPCTPAANGFTRNGYTWSGWYDKTSGGTKYTTITLTAAKTLYAQWGANPISISYNPNGGGGTIPIQTCYYNTPCTLKTNTFTRTGYSFDGWYIAATGGTKLTTISATGNTTVYAHWKANNYTLTYFPSGLCNPTTKTVAYDAKYGTLCTPSRAGQTFNGWYTAASGGTKVDANTKMTTTGATIYAHFNVNNYTLTYNSNGGNACSPETKSVAYGAAYGTLCTPGRTGYSFAGWYTAASGGTKVDANTKMGAGNTTIYAHWNANTFTVSYDANGGSGSMANTTCTYDANCNLRSNSLSKSGYTFAGWATSATGKVAYANGANVKNAATSGTLTLYARWRSDVITLKIKLHDNEVIHSPTETGGKSSTWGKDSSGFITRKVDGVTSVYYAQFRRGESISFNPANHRNTSFIFITKYGYGADYEKAWICESGCKGTVYFSDGPMTINTNNIIADDNYDGNIVLRVNWRPAKVIIMYHVNSGTPTILPSGYTVDGFIYDTRPSPYLHQLNTTGKMNDIGGISGLMDYNYNKFVTITKPRGKSNPPSGKEWARKYDNDYAYHCKKGTYNQQTNYDVKDFCDATAGDCVCALKVNWQ